jgi:hypothetical protein
MYSAAAGRRKRRCRFAVVSGKSVIINLASSAEYIRDARKFAECGSVDHCPTK